MKRSAQLEELIIAEKKAERLFKEIELRELIQSGKTEKEINNEIYELAFELFGIRKYWHKRIVRSGRNTLLPYRNDPPDLKVETDDILFLDFGPVFEDWEADYGRTYTLGENPKKLKLKKEVELAWYEGKKFYDANKTKITGSELYHHTKKLAENFGWTFGHVHCGHLIGSFPHEHIQGENNENYIHPDNLTMMSALDRNGNDRFWIYEIHFIDEELQIGGFFEQLLD